MQKFQRGDHVQIADDLGPCMSYFTSGVDAIVMGSYNDKYGGGNTKSYTLLLRNKGTSSWYDEWQLALIEKDRMDIAKQWEAEIQARIDRESCLDWIFANGDEVLKTLSGATASALGECLGISNMWGSRGEGIVFFQNAMAVAALAEPFLRTNDKEGWLAFCQNSKKAHSSPQRPQRPRKE